MNPSASDQPENRPAATGEAAAGAPPESGLAQRLRRSLRLVEPEDVARADQEQAVGVFGDLRGKRA